MPSDQTARTIAEGLLTRAGDGLLLHDFECFASCFRFPYKVETITNDQTLEHPDDLRAIFDNVILHFRRSRVTRMERTVIEATFRDHETISFTHQSRLLNGSHLIQDPYPVFSVVTYEIDTGWRFESGVYALADNPEDTNAIQASILHAPLRLD